MAQQFPGGFAEFAQLAGQLPEDMLEELMIHAVENNGQGLGMPGQMPGQGIFDDVPQPDRVELAAPQAPPRMDLEEEDVVDEEEDGDEDEAEDADIAVRLSLRSRLEPV